MAKIEIEPIELMALKKLALISGALAQTISNTDATRELKALTSVLIEVINRADVVQATQR